MNLPQKQRTFSGYRQCGETPLTPSVVVQGIYWQVNRTLLLNLVLLEKTCHPESRRPNKGLLEREGLWFHHWHGTCIIMQKPLLSTAVPSPHYENPSSRHRWKEKVVNTPAWTITRSRYARQDNTKNDGEASWGLWGGIYKEIIGVLSTSEWTGIPVFHALLSYVPVRVR